MYPVNANMQIPLTSPARKISLVLASVFFWRDICGSQAAQFAGAYFSGRPDLASLQRAVRWQPGNADYRHRLGRYFFLIQRSPEAAVEAYRAAVGSESTSGARYWFDLARRVPAAGQHGCSRKRRLERGLVADSSTPDLAWEAGNFYLVQGEPRRRCRNSAWSWKAIPTCPRLR